MGQEEARILARQIRRGETYKIKDGIHAWARFLAGDSPPGLTWEEFEDQILDVLIGQIEYAVGEARKGVSDSFGILWLFAQSCPEQFAKMRLMTHDELVRLELQQETRRMIANRLMKLRVSTEAENPEIFAELTKLCGELTDDGVSLDELVADEKLRKQLQIGIDNRSFVL